MFARKFDDVFTGLECLFHPYLLRLLHVLNLSHDALGHNYQRLALKYLEKLRFGINWIFSACIDKVTINENFERRYEFVDNPEKIDKFVVFLSPFDSHLIYKYN